MTTEILNIESVRENTLEAQIQKVNEIITKELEKKTGQSAVKIDFALMDSTLNTLESKGYSVLSHPFDDNGIVRKQEIILWKDLKEKETEEDIFLNNPNSEVSNKALDYKNILIFFNKLKEAGHPDNLALEVALQYPKALTLVDKLKEIGYTDNLAIQLALQYPLEK